MVSYEDNVTQSWTFQSRWDCMDNMLVSSGRWDDMADAAKAAAKWVQACADNNTVCTVEIISVEEINMLDEGGKPL